jgi:HD-like signal output (HDOD) protein
MALPPLPATAQKILTCFGDEFIDAVKVASVVEGDPGICAKLLGLSNSAYFGLAEPVNNIGEAISRVLGVDTVRSLVLAMAIQQSFNSKNCPSFDVERFWLQALLTAECCKRIIAEDDEADDADRDLAYSAGLCHNLGLMALAHVDPQKTHTALAKHRKSAQPDSLAALLSDQFDTDHKIMTAEIGRTWGLPAPMVAAYQYRAFPASHCEARLGFIVAAAVAAVENAEVAEEERADLSALAAPLELDAEKLQEMAIFSDKQKERVQSLASNMTR